MRGLSKAILCLSIVGISAASSAADVYVDGELVTDVEVLSIIHDPVNNRIDIETDAGDATIAPTSAPPPPTITEPITVSVTANPATITIGDSTTVSWAATNSYTTCTPAGAVAAWTSLPPGQNGQVQITPDQTGNWVFAVDCVSVDDSAQAVANVAVNPVVQGPVQILSIDSVDNSVTLGEEITITWETQNATSCTPLKGNDAWRQFAITLPNGSATFTADVVGDDIKFQLKCDGQNGPKYLATKVDVLPQQGTVSCSTPTLSGSTIEWSSLFGTNFPGPISDTESTTISRSQYKAVRFNTGNVVDHGKITTVENTVSGSAVRRGTISQCKGKFKNPITNVCSWAWGVGGGINWSTDGTSGCQLEPNTTYYLNLTFTDGSDPNTTTCPTSSCRMDVQHFNLD